MQAVIEQIKSLETKMELRFDKFDSIDSKLSTIFWLLIYLVTITTVSAGLEIFN